tara:strand:- start:558 stop:1643 length:1086 start_codon:yes stop_codon:yes gene_type:complete
MATYTQFSNSDTVDSIDRVFSSAWSGNINELTNSIHTSSTQYPVGEHAVTSSAAFHLEVYNSSSAGGTSEVQFSIAYGSLTGKGGEDFDDGVGAENISATKAIYSQYRNLVFGGDETQNFSFDGHTPDGIYVININRARYKNAIRMGNFKLALSTPPSASGTSSLGSTFHTINLSDDSVTTSGSANAIRAGVGREFNIVSGSNGIRVGSSNTYVDGSGSFGYVYPDAGFLILNQDALDFGSGSGIGLNTNTSADAACKNPLKLFECIKKGGSFIVDAQEDIASKYYFVRVFNQDFNYTTNDSFTANDGTLSFDSMIDNPQTYITTVGLYNDNQDLLAVAKLSQPLPKNFTKEALIKVKLDY